MLNSDDRAPQDAQLQLTPITVPRIEVPELRLRVTDLDKKLEENTKQVTAPIVPLLPFFREQHPTTNSRVSELAEIFANKPQIEPELLTPKLKDVYQPGDDGFVFKP